MTASGSATLDASPGTGPSAPAGSSTTAKSGTSSTSSSGTSTGTSAPARDRALDQRKAERAVLRPNEIPSGPWTKVRDQDPPDDGPLGVDCGPLTDAAESVKAATDAAPQGRSPVYTAGQGVELSEIVAVFATAEEADLLVDTYTDPSMPGCVAEIVARQAEEDAEPGVTLVGEPLVTAIPVVAKADAGFGFQIRLDIDNNGTRAPVYATYAYIRIDRAIAEVQVVTLGAPSAAQIEALAQVTQLKMSEQFA